MKSQRNWSDLIILLLLPAPLTGIAIMFLLVYIIGSGSSVSLGNDDSTTSIAAIAPTRTLSANAAAIATISAAPALPPAPTATPIDLSSGAVVEVASALGYSEEMVATGRKDFLAICAACHGPDAMGISGLGKPLVGSEFVNSQDDQQVLTFVKTGRPPWDPANTTGVDMPSKGGNPALTDEDLLSIIAYIRVLNGSGSTTEASASFAQPAASEVEPTTSQPVEVVEFTPFDVNGLLASLGVVLPDPVTQPAREGETIFNDLCAARTGYDLLKSQGNICTFLTENAESYDETQLFDLLQQGDPIWSPDNISGVHIPARVGYPPLTDDEIRSLIQYILSL